MIYAISDIHGCFKQLQERLKLVDLTGSNRIIFLGDYIDYGPQSCEVLKFLYDLQQKYGKDKIIILKGNHEALFLEWLEEYGSTNPSEFDALTTFNDWLRTDSNQDFKTFRTFLSKERFSEYEKAAKKASFDTLNRLAVQMVLEENRTLIRWMKTLPCFYETDRQIFVHAGIDESKGSEWKWRTPEDVFLWKFPPEKGQFYKTIIAGHVGTGIKELADNQEFHDVFFDGESHYYIDGSVYRKGGKLLLLAYDEEHNRYDAIP